MDFLILPGLLAILSAAAVASPRYRLYGYVGFWLAAAALAWIIPVGFGADLTWARGRLPLTSPVIGWVPYLLVGGLLLGAVGMATLPTLRLRLLAGWFVVCWIVGALLMVVLLAALVDAPVAGLLVAILIGYLAYVARPGRRRQTFEAEWALPVPPAEAFELVADPRRQPELNPMVRAVALVGADEPGPGVRMIVSYRGGLRALEEIRVWEPPHHVVEGVVSRRHGELDLRLDPTPSGTTLHLRSALIVPFPWALLSGRAGLAEAAGKTKANRDRWIGNIWVRLGYPAPAS